MTQQSLATRWISIFDHSGPQSLLHKTSHSYSHFEQKRKDLDGIHYIKGEDDGKKVHAIAGKDLSPESDRNDDEGSNSYDY